jgi:hypothetical protein
MIGIKNLLSIEKLSVDVSISYSERSMEHLMLVNLSMEIFDTSYMLTIDINSIACNREFGGLFRGSKFVIVNATK